MTSHELPEFNEDYPNYGVLARAWAERIPIEGDLTVPQVLGPGLRALTYALLDGGKSVEWVGGAVAEALRDAAAN